MVRAARDSILGRAVQRKEAVAAAGAATGAAEEQEEKAELTVRCAKRDAGGREPDSVYMVGAAEPREECEPARASSWNVGETDLYENLKRKEKLKGGTTVVAAYASHCGNAGKLLSMAERLPG